MNDITTEKMAEVQARPTISIDAFEKAQRNLLADLETKLVALEAGYTEKVENTTKFYEDQLGELNHQIKDWTALITGAKEMVKSMTTEKKETLTEMKELHAKEVDAQRRMIAFQREGLIKLRA